MDLIRAPGVTVYDASLHQLTALSKYTSLSFSRSWQSVGDPWSLTTPEIEKVLPYVKKGNYILLGADQSRAGIITGATFSETQKGKEITITGYPALRVTHQRINLRPADPALAALNFQYDAVPMVTANGGTRPRVSPEEICRTYVARHLVSPEDTKRKHPLLELGRLRTAGDVKTMYLAENGTPLDDTLSAICERDDIGQVVMLDPHRKKLIYEVVPGMDKTRRQSKYRPVVLGPKHLNVQSVRYTTDQGSFANVIYGVGAENADGSLRAMQAYTDEDDLPSGSARHEALLDCGSALAVDGTDLSMEDLVAQEFANRKEAESITCDVVNAGPYRFRVDYDVGDLVTVELPSYGISADMRVAAATESWSGGGYALSIVLGKAVDIRRRLRQAIKLIR